MLKGVSRKLKILFLLGIFLLPLPVQGSAYNSSNYIVRDPVVSAGGQNSSSSSFKIGQSVSQTAIGKSTSGSFQLLAGFQYFLSASPNVLSASAGDGQVSLSWTIPQTYGGLVVASYDVGVGTASGVYTYSSVGAVTSFLQTGLNNGTVYYFKVRAKTAGGVVLTSSNEAVAAPSGTASSQSSGGGGGSGRQITFSGFAAPKGKVYVLLNGSIMSNASSLTDGSFEISLGGLGPGVLNFVLYFTDITGLRSNFVNVKTDSGGQGGRISGILLPPTLSADKTEVKAGDDIRFFGFSIPASSVVLNMSSQSKQVETADDGRFEAVFSTAGFNIGQYNAQAKAVKGNDSTPFSLVVRFLVGSENILAPQTGACPARADFNNDCKVDLVDFSILAYWYKRPGFPETVDLNKDGSVDLVDFSILAYYWQP